MNRSYPAMWQVEEIRNKERILAFLDRDRIYAAYAIGDLEPALYAHCRWFVASREGEPRTLALYFAGLAPHAMVTMGEPEGLAAILSGQFRPDEAYFISPPDHLGAIQQTYRTEPSHDMIRMFVRPEGFRPAPATAVRLGAGHLTRLQALYAWGNVYGFSGYQLADGMFYGVLEGDELVAAAGTHVMAPTYGVAAVGNIFTHPAHRGKGHATACTSAVSAALLEMGLEVVLNVAANNQVAIHVYERLGFREHCHFAETMARRL